MKRVAESMAFWSAAIVAVSLFVISIAYDDWADFFGSPVWATIMGAM